MNLSKTVFLLLFVGLIHSFIFTRWDRHVAQVGLKLFVFLLSAGIAGLSHQVCLNLFILVIWGFSLNVSSGSLPVMEGADVVILKHSDSKKVKVCLSWHNMQRQADGPE